MSPTERTLKELRKRGYMAAVVEKWIPVIKQRKDLFGIIDVLGIRKGETIAIQTTSGSNVSDRVKKIADSDKTPVIREAGWRLVVWGWAKRADGKWHLREVDCS